MYWIQLLNLASNFIILNLLAVEFYKDVHNEFYTKKRYVQNQQNQISSKRLMDGIFIILIYASSYVQIFRMLSEYEGMCYVL